MPDSLPLADSLSHLEGQNPGWHLVPTYLPRYESYSLFLARRQVLHSVSPKRSVCLGVLFSFPDDLV